MIDPNKILAVDDEPQTLNVYRDLLAEDGLELRTAATMTQAIAALDEGDWALVLLDQRLHGAQGSDDGLTLIEEVQRRSPGAKVIVVTGYASPDAIDRAFAAGIYDYVEKTESFETLLRAKVRNATELARERWLASLSGDAVSQQLTRLWAEARTEPERARKGRLLEDLLELLLKQIPGFVVVSRRRSADEEFELVVRNESTDPLWSKDSQYFLVECKNWSSKVGPDELDRFVNKLERRHGRAKLGFFVAPNGFTDGFTRTLATRRREHVLVVPLDDQALNRMVAGPDRGEVLKDLHQRAVESIAGEK
jgi:CheY-like chemotaxis protein